MSFLSETPLALKGAIALSHRSLSLADGIRAYGYALALKGAIAREELSFPYSSLSLFYVTLKREREGERRKGMRGGMI